MNDSVIRRRALAGAALSLAALGLAGCVVAPVGPYGEPVVAAAPPPPQAEVVGVAPAVGYVWISGYWNWGGARYVWVPGYWSPPRPGYHWVPHRWERHPKGWRQRPGHWERR